MPEGSGTPLGARSARAQAACVPLQSRGRSLNPMARSTQAAAARSRVSAHGAPVSCTANVVVGTSELAKCYGSAAAPVQALRGVTLSIPQGERVALLGKSGSGKSTLLNVLGGLDRPSSGSVHVGGHDLTRLSARDLARHRLLVSALGSDSLAVVDLKTQRLDRIIGDLPEPEGA